MAKVLVVSAGTADVPVVDECVITLHAYGFQPDRLTDVGVADIDANNRVASTRVADARIAYTGKGDLARASGTRVVVLITDGEETCGGDPAAAVRAIHRTSVRASATVPSRAVRPLSSRNEGKCVPMNTIWKPQVK